MTTEIDVAQKFAYNLCEYRGNMSKREVKKPVASSGTVVKSVAPRIVRSEKDAPSVTGNTIMVFSGPGEIDSKGSFAHSLPVTATPGQVLTSGTDGAITWASGSGGSTVISFTVAIS